MMRAITSMAKSPAMGRLSNHLENTLWRCALLFFVFVRTALPDFQESWTLRPADLIIPAVQLDPQGKLLVAAQNVADGNPLVLRKYSVTGEQLWSKTFSDITNGAPQKVLLSTSGPVYVCGSFSPGLARVAPFLAAFNGETGERLWWRAFPWDEPISAWDLAPAASGGVSAVTSGRTRQHLIFTEWAVAGDLVQSNQFEVPVILEGVTLSQQKNLFLTGFSPTNVLHHSLMKVAATGETIWANWFHNGPDLDHWAQIAVWGEMGAPEDLFAKGSDHAGSFVSGLNHEGHPAWRAYFDSSGWVRLIHDANDRFYAARSTSTSSNWFVARFDSEGREIGALEFQSAPPLTFGPIVSFERQGTNFALAGNAGLADPSPVIVVFSETGTPAVPPFTIAFTTNVVLEGQSAECSIFALPPGEYAYQWFRSGAALPNETNSVLRLAPVTADDDGHYAVEITSGLNRWVSAAAPLKVYQPPIVEVLPPRDAVIGGTRVISTIISQGTEPLEIQWRFADTDLPGATNSKLTLTNLQLAHTGRYSVTIKNTAGEATAHGNLRVLDAIREIDHLHLEHRVEKPFTSGGHTYAFYRNPPTTGLMKWASNTVLYATNIGAVKSDGDGNLYYAQNSASGSTLGKLDAQLRPKWTNKYAISFDDNFGPPAFDVMPDGESAVSGRISISGRLSAQVTRVSPDGKLRWSRTLTNETPIALKFGSDGMLYWLGYADNITPIRKFSPTGEILWSNIFNRPFFLSHNELLIDPHGRPAFLAGPDPSLRQLIYLDPATGRVDGDAHFNHTAGVRKITFSPNGGILFLDGSFLRCFDPHGLLRWRTPVPANDCDLAVGPSGHLLVSGGRRVLLIDPFGQKLWEWFPADITLSSIGAEWLDASHFLVTYAYLVTEAHQTQTRGGLILLETIDQTRAPRIVNAPPNPSLLAGPNQTISPVLVNENASAFQWSARVNGAVAKIEGATNRSLSLPDVLGIPTPTGYFFAASNSFGSLMSPEFLIPPSLQITNLSLTSTGSVRLQSTGSTSARINIQQSRSLTNWKSIDLPSSLRQRVDTNAISERAGFYRVIPVY